MVRRCGFVSLHVSHVVTVEVCRFSLLGDIVCSAMAECRRVETQAGSSNFQSLLHIGSPQAVNQCGSPPKRVMYRVAHHRKHSLRLVS